MSILHAYNFSETKTYYERRKIITLSPCMCLGDDLVLSGVYTNTIPHGAAPVHRSDCSANPCPRPHINQAETLRSWWRSLCQGSSRPAPGLMAHSVDSQDSACSHTHGHDLSQQSKIGKGKKLHGAKLERNQAQASDGPLSVESHRMHLIPPAPVVTGPGNATHQGSLPEPGSSGCLSEGQSRRHH